MQAFLSPGISLLGRFGFARKFQLLFLLFILPLAGSLLMIGQDYRAKLSLISGERAGVRQLLALDALDNLLSAQRDRAARLGFGAGSNIACVDASGDIACFELAPAGWAEWPAVRGRVSHSNHYLSPALQAVQAPMAAALSTQSRLETSCRHGEAAQMDRAGLEAFLRDTGGGYLAVCRHPDPALPPEACVESVAGVMIDATARQMWVAPGVPDTVAFALV